MAKLNCWEYKKCGREKGGEKANKLGVCPATLPGKDEGVNRGENRGRTCWAIAGTFCADGFAQGIYAQKIGNCLDCDFFQMVKKEEGANYQFLPEDQIKYAD